MTTELITVIAPPSQVVTTIIVQGPQGIPGTGGGTITTDDFDFGGFEMTPASINADFGPL